MTIQARFSGTCHDCGERWQPGDLIRCEATEPGSLPDWRHAVCPESIFVKLTPDEARRVARGLLEAADAADPQERAEVNIQWKGVDICADWQCVCTPDEEAFEWHVDGYTGGRLECDRCGRVYQITHTAVATPREECDR